MLKIEAKKVKDILEVRLILDDKDWTDFIKKAQKKIVSEVEIKGFRKGKAPEERALKDIKQDDIHAKAVDFAVDAKIGDVIKEIQKYNIITKPRLTIENVSNKAVTLLFVSHLLPSIKLPDYLGFKLEYNEKKITNDDIEKEMNKFKDLFKSKEAYEDVNHKIEDGDIAKIDFVGKIDGTEFEDGSAKDFELKIGSKSFIDNFEDQLIGLKVGEEKDIKVNFPKAYPVENLAGKEATFNVKINAILNEKTANEDKLNEKLSANGFSSIEELEDKIKEMLVEQSKQLAADTFFNKLVDMIVEHKDTIIEIPEKLLEDEIEHQFGHFKENLEQQNVKIEDYFEMLKTNEKKFKEDNLKNAAEKRVKDGLIYSKLIEENNISDISFEEYEKEYEKIASLQKMNIEDVKRQISQERLRDSLIFLKLIEFLKLKLNK